MMKTHFCSSFALVFQEVMILFSRTRDGNTVLLTNVLRHIKSYICNLQWKQRYCKYSNLSFFLKFPKDYYRLDRVQFRVHLITSLNFSSRNEYSSCSDSFQTVQFNESLTGSNKWFTDSRHDEKYSKNIKICQALKHFIFHLLLYHYYIYYYYIIIFIINRYNFLF